MIKLKSYFLSPMRVAVTRDIQFKEKLQILRTVSFINKLIAELAIELRSTFCISERSILCL